MTFDPSISPASKGAHGRARGARHAGSKEGIGFCYAALAAIVAAR
jgi:hypothetical protein